MHWLSKLHIHRKRRGVFVQTVTIQLSGFFDPHKKICILTFDGQVGVQGNLNPNFPLMAPISLCPAKTFRRRGSRVTRKCDHYCDQEFAATRKLFAFTRRLHDVTDRRCWRGSEIFRLKPSYLLQAWRHRMLEFWFSEHISQNLCLIFCGPQISYSVPRTILSRPPRFKFFGVFSFGSYN